MDSLYLGASIVVQHLKLSLHVDQVRDTLEHMIEDTCGKPPILSLVAAFGKHKRLVPALGSWISEGANDKLSASDVIEIFGEASITRFAESLMISDHDSAAIVAEILPIMIEKSAKFGEISQKLSANREQKPPLTLVDNGYRSA